MVAIRIFIALALLACGCALGGEPQPVDAAPPDAGLFVPPADAVRQKWVPPLAGAARDGAPAGGGTGRVRWRAWGAEAFAEAEKSGKPVLLFITADWCHWGRVMEASTFTDLETATRLNEEFIPIRLNRDERPDVDLRMQQAVQALGFGRGWPLTACLTPGGRPFFGGTYVPADDDAGLERPGMRSLVQFLAGTWRKRRDEAGKQAGALEAAFQKAAAGENSGGALPPGALKLAASAIQAALDPKAGGLLGGGAGGKFPAPRAIDALLAHAYRAGVRGDGAAARADAERSVDALLHGALFDHLDGGFHRCSADRWWRAPRFEKLLVPNAELLVACLHAWQATGNPHYRRAVEETLNFWNSFSDSAGVFFLGAQAAESADGGGYFTWTVRDFEAALRDDAECELGKAYFGVGELGGLPGEGPHRNALYEALPLAQSARRAGIPAAQSGAALERVRAALRARRSARPPPLRDENAYTDGNALMAAAFIECGRALGSEARVQRGLNTLRALLRKGVPHGADGKSGPAPHVIAPRAGAPAAVALSQDEAALAYACTVAFEATGDAYFSAEAEASLRRLDANFWDAERGGYRDRAAPGTPGAEAFGPEWPVRIFQDTTEPPANAVAALAWLRLGELTGRGEFSEKGAATLRAFGAALKGLGPYGAALSGAADALQSGFCRIDVMGKPGDPAFGALLAAANAAYLPCKIVVRKDPGDPNAAASTVVRVNGKARSATDPAALEKLLREEP